MEPTERSGLGKEWVRLQYKERIAAACNPHAISWSECKRLWRLETPAIRASKRQSLRANRLFADAVPRRATVVYPWDVGLPSYDP